MLTKRDANHLEIKRVLDQVTRIQDVSFLHGFGCDLLAQHKDGRLLLLEIKLPRSRNRLTDSEVKLQARFPECFIVVTTPEEALRAVGFAP